MSRRYWLPIIAAIGLTLAAQQTAEAQGSQRSAAKAQPAPKQQTQPSIPPALQNSLDRIGTALEAQNKKGESAEEKRKAEEDRGAQLNMARSARRMFWVGVAEAFITFAGVMLVLATLIYTKRAAHAAEAAVNEAKEATKATRAVGEAQNKISETGQRAWIQIESVRLIPPTTIPNLDQVARPQEVGARMTKLTIQVALRNIGLSPASGLQVSCKYLGSDLGPPMTENRVLYGQFRGGGGSVLLPGDQEIRAFGFSGEPPSFFFRDIPHPHFLIELDVCATYRISTGTDIHKTQYGYKDAVSIGAGRIGETILTRDGARDHEPT